MLHRFTWLLFGVFLIVGCATVEDQDEIEAAAVRAGLDPRKCVLHKRAVKWLYDQFPDDVLARIKCQRVTWHNPPNPTPDYVDWDIKLTVRDLRETMGASFAGFNCIGLKDAIDGHIRKIVNDKKEQPRHCYEITTEPLPAELTDESTVSDSEALAELLEHVPMPMPGGAPVLKGFPVFCPHAGGCPDSPSDPFDPQEPGEPGQGDW